MRAVTVFAVGLVSLSLGGCLNGVQHNDVLIFGTDTKLALDISANPTTAGTPELTIGYKRQEAVWMPLVMNGKGVAPVIVSGACKNPAGQPTPCADDLNALKYQGEAETPKDGKSGKDAYSVFASFGANIKGTATGGPEAAVGLAQFFATGVAAQRLAQNSQVVSALSLHGPESGAVAAAAAQAVAPMNEAAMRLQIAALDASKKDVDVATRYYACGVIKGAATLSAAVIAADTSAEAKALRADLAAAKSAADVQLAINTFGHRADVESAAKTTCP